MLTSRHRSRSRSALAARASRSEPMREGLLSLILLGAVWLVAVYQTNEEAHALAGGQDRRPLVLRLGHFARFPHIIGVIVPAVYSVRSHNQYQMLSKLRVPNQPRIDSHHNIVFGYHRYTNSWR
jgi:hypothetical protein